MRDFLSVSTALVLLAVWAGDVLLAPRDSDTAFIPSQGQQQQLRPLQASHGLAQEPSPYAVPRPLAAVRESLGAKGLIGYGMAFGVLVAMVRGAGSRSATRAPMRAADIEVAEQTEYKPIPYLENVPRSIIEKRALNKLLSQYPREQWDDPPEDSELYTLKCLAEVYGEGKATRMGWWDYYYMRVTLMDEDQNIWSGEEIKAAEEAEMKVFRGELPLLIPGPSWAFDSGAVIKWTGPEPFAGDQCQTLVTNGRFTVQFMNAMAFYREGLKPWQRGIEIGMAHGYFIIGPFVALGPLRNTPEAATVGLLAGVALIGIFSAGGLIFGATVKPTLFDEPGKKPSSGYTELVNWHALGGVGGAGFAHALITIFGS